MPLGSTCEPSSCMSSLFHWEFSSSFSSSRREGRRGGATQIQRLICLLVKRNSRLHFLMRALIKSGGVWPENGGGRGQRDAVAGERYVFLPSIAIWSQTAGEKPWHTENTTRVQTYFLSILNAKQIFQCSFITTWNVVKERTIGRNEEWEKNLLFVIPLFYSLGMLNTRNSNHFLGKGLSRILPQTKPTGFSDLCQSIHLLWRQQFFNNIWIPGLL